MRRIVLAGGALVAVVVVVAAQPPVAPPLTPPAAPASPPAFSPAPVEPQPPTPPRPLPAAGAPGVPVPPNALTETPLSKFVPLTAFPQTTQDAVGAAVRGSSWLAKMHQPHGRFHFGYNPALRQPMTGEHDLKQARCALAMAQSAKFCGDEKQAAVAGQTILALLAATKVAPNDPACRVPVQVSFVCNRVGFAALLVLAIYELPAPDDKLTDDAERLCEFLRRQVLADGAVHYTDNPSDVPVQIDPAGVNEYPGLALQALAASHRARPADGKLTALKTGVAHYATLFRAKPTPMLAATVLPAATDLYLLTKSNEAATAAFEMADWLCAIQIPQTDPRTPQWAGGFRVVVNGQATDAPPGAVETGAYLQGLACAYPLTRLTADLARERRYRPAVGDAVSFLCGMQFSEQNTRHFENSFRVSVLIGGFYLSPADGNLRTDATACAVTALLRFLSSGAERGGQ